MEKDLLGYLAGGLLTFGFMPQVWRLYKLKSAREISLPWALLFVLGTSLWLTYGIAFSLPPVILWNAITLVLGFALLFAKIKYGRK